MREWFCGSFDVRRRVYRHECGVQSAGDSTRVVKVTSIGGGRYVVGCVLQPKRHIDVGVDNKVVASEFYGDQSAVPGFDSVVTTGPDEGKQQEGYWSEMAHRWLSRGA